MAALEFNRQDIEDLAQKVSTLWQYFNDQERALMLAIFAAAADRAKPPSQNSPATLPKAEIPGQIPGEGGGEEAGADDEAALVHIKQQLLSAYVAGNSFNSVTSGPDVGRIGRIGGESEPLSPSPAQPGG